MSLGDRPPRDERFRPRVPLSQRVPDAFSDPKPPPGWRPAAPPPAAPAKPAMPPWEHEALETKLYKAAGENDLATLRDVLACPWSWHADEPIRAAGLAARAGAVSALAMLLDSGIDASATTREIFNREIGVNVGSEPLMNFAAAGGSIAAAEMLLSRGAAVGAADGSGRTPLHEAAAKGHADMVRWLLARGAEPDPLGFEGTPLEFAVSCDRADIVRILLSAGADPQKRHSACASPLQAATDKPVLLAILTNTTIGRHGC